MTTEDSNRLAALWTAYQTAKSNYDQEKIDNYNFRQGWITTSNGGTTPNGNDRFWWEKMVKASDASLILKEGIMKDALRDYNLFKADLTAAEQAAFQAANPEIAVQIKQEELKAANESKAIELAAKNAAAKTIVDANYADKANQTVLIVVIVVIVIVVVGFFVIRSRRKKQGGAAAS